MIATRPTGETIDRISSGVAKVMNKKETEVPWKTFGGKSEKALRLSIDIRLTCP